MRLGTSTPQHKIIIFKKAREDKINKTKKRLNNTQQLSGEALVVARCLIFNKCLFNIAISLRHTHSEEDRQAAETHQSSFSTNFITGF